MSYDSLDAFVRDLPQLAEPVRDSLVGHDGLFLLQCGEKSHYITLSQGAVTVSQVSDHAPLCVVSAEEKNLLDVINGKVNPMKALLFGKLSVRGDVKPLLRLCSLL